jgi:hypothetical protein
MTKPQSTRNAKKPNGTGNAAVPESAHGHNQRTRIDPEQFPFFDESYSFAARERELALLDSLLAEKLSNVRAERNLVRHRIVTGDFGLEEANGAAPA